MNVATKASSLEVTFGVEDVIVSKTDLKGHITYANKTFAEVSGYGRAELLGRPHSLIRHQDMPGAIFKLLWETIAGGEEIFAYVKNATKSGGYYWVLAHVTPSRDRTGRIVAYHSNRRCPDRAAVESIEPLYRSLRHLESAQPNKAAAAEVSLQALRSRLADAGLTYEQLVWPLIHGDRLGLGDV